MTVVTIDQFAEKEKEHGYKVLFRTDEVTDRGYMWTARCRCGELFTAVSSQLRNGNRRTCGCRNEDSHWQGYQPKKGSQFHVPESPYTRGAFNLPLLTTHIEKGWYYYES